MSFYGQGMWKPSRGVSQALNFTYFSSKDEWMLPEVGDWVDVSSGGMNE